MHNNNTRGNTSVPFGTCVFFVCIIISLVNLAQKTNVINGLEFDCAEIGDAVGEREFEHSRGVLRFLVGLRRGDVTYFLNLSYQRPFESIQFTGLKGIFINFIIQMSLPFKNLSE